jgi:uncharacterized OB-fold protein
MSILTTLWNRWIGRHTERPSQEIVEEVYEATPNGHFPKRRCWECGAFVGRNQKHCSRCGEWLV